MSIIYNVLIIMLIIICTYGTTITIKDAFKAH